VINTLRAGLRIYRT